MARERKHGGGRKRTGTIQRYEPAKDGERYGHYVARCPAPDGSGRVGSRPLFHLDPSPKSKQAEKAAREHAAGITEDLWARGLGAVGQRRTASSPARTPGADGEMDDWFELWIAERERRGMTSTPENRSHYVHHVMAALGTKHVRDRTAEDLRGLWRSLDGKVQAGALSWKTATNVWGAATKMCQDAATAKHEALRVRSDNPAADVLGPDRGARTVKQYLYPSEFQKFIACTEVPLEWRRAVALAIYLFPRGSELRVLRWEDVDPEHSTVHVYRETATRAPRSPPRAASPGVLRSSPGYSRCCVSSVPRTTRAPSSSSRASATWRVAFGAG